MNTFFIATHIKIAIQSLYCIPCHIVITLLIPLFLFIISFIALPYGHIDIAKAEINMNDILIF